MIEKVVSIANVGKLRKHDATGDQAFRKLTVVYGDNAIGKTTLAAILDSLRERTPTGVVGRKTLGSSEPQSIRILTSAGVRTFADGEWDDSYPLLEVFNSDFVSRVVYSGDYVTNDHQKNLCSLLVGRTAVTEGKRLEELRSELNAVNARLRELESDIKPHIRGAQDVEAFSKLPPRDNVEQLLDAAKRQLSAAENLASVLVKPMPARTDLPSLDESFLADALGRSVDCISADALARIDSHRDSRMGGSGAQWLRDGMRYVKDDRCPFCDQTLSESDFFKALQQYFSDAYEDYERSLQGDLRELLAQCDPATLRTAAERLLRQRAVTITWAQQVNAIDSVALAVDLSSQIDTAVNCSSAIRDAIAKKQADPLHAIGIDSLQTALDGLRESVASLNSANAEVGAAIREIASFVESAKGADVASLKSEVERLENQRARHDASVAPLCVEYLDLVIKKEEVTGAGKAA
ncbi:MAG: AAA family ATPase [Coriobacteriia bacterium]